MAKRFRFRLEPVRRYRARLEEARLQELAETQRGVVEQRNYLQGLDREKRTGQEEVVRMYEAREDFSHILLVHRYINTVNLRNVFGERELTARTAEMSRRRERFIEARQRRRVLDLLKERRAQEHRRAEDSVEVRFLNELALQIARRTRRGAADPEAAEGA
ncbi:MAG: hypothetical protein V1918_09795 [Planctomycetota bacterium]